MVILWVPCNFAQIPKIVSFDLIEFKPVPEIALLLLSVFFIDKFFRFFWQKLSDDFDNFPTDLSNFLLQVLFIHNDDWLVDGRGFLEQLCWDGPPSCPPLGYFVLECGCEQLAVVFCDLWSFLHDLFRELCHIFISLCLLRQLSHNSKLF